MISNSALFESPEPKAPTKKMTADKSNRRFRPKRSLIGPITTAPITAPIKTAAVIHPSIQAQELTCQLSFSIKSSAPDMTPVSYPNNKPPKAPKK